MSTITKELAKLFRKITNSEIDAEGNAHVVLSPADSLLINNARIALASLEAEAVAYMHHSGQVVTREECCDDKIFAICCKVETPSTQHHSYRSQRCYLCPLRWKWMMTLTARLNTEKLSAGTPIAQPCFRQNLQVIVMSYRRTICKDTKTDWSGLHNWQRLIIRKQVTGCTTTQSSLPVAIRKGPDMPTVQDGNSPVTPDCWCRICRPVTMSDMRFVVCPECGNKRCPHANDHNNACTGSNEPGRLVAHIQQHLNRR